MKILTIGDIHGRNCWKEIISDSLNEFDKIIFIGDYCDSFNVSPFEIISNLKEIIQLKENNPERVELLLGNHDIHYMKPSAPQGSGWNAAFHHQYKDLFNQNEDLFTVAYQYQDHLWTHAGVHSKWFNDLYNSCWNPESRFHPIIVEDNPQTVAELINWGFMTGNHLLWDTKIGPFWIRPNKLKHNRIEGLTQIVGHTYTETIVNEDGIWFVDCLDFGVDGLILEI